MGSLADLDWYVLVLTGWLGGEHVRDFCVGCSLPTNGTLDGTPPWAHAVLFHNDSNTLVTEAVSTRQHGPLEKREERDIILKYDYG